MGEGQSGGGSREGGKSRRSEEGRRKAATGSREAGRKSERQRTADEGAVHGPILWDCDIYRNTGRADGIQPSKCLCGVREMVCRPWE